jgi:hypothetical protein
MNVIIAVCGQVVGCFNIDDKALLSVAVDA